MTKRIEVYLDETVPLIEYYNEQEKLITVDGVKAINEVFNDIVTFLGSEP